MKFKMLPLNLQTIKPLIFPSSKTLEKPFISTFLTPKLLKMSSPSSSSSSWTCSTCTFINPPSQKTLCQICLTPQPSPLSLSLSSSSNPKWACKSCTFLNPYHNPTCEICGTHNSASVSSFLDHEIDDSEGGASVGTVFLPLQACTRSVGSKGKVEVVKAEALSEASTLRGRSSGKRKLRDEEEEEEDDDDQWVVSDELGLCFFYSIASWVFNFSLWVVELV